MTQAGKEAPAAEKKREKRTITEIRESKRTGEKMVYMSVPDYTSAKWAGDGGRRRGGGGRQPGHDRARPPLHHPRHHGHDGDARAGDPARRAQHLRAGVHALPELQHRRPRAHNATRFMQQRAATRSSRKGGKSQAHILEGAGRRRHPTASHIGLTPHTIAMFGGFKIQGRTAEAAMKILEDALAIEDAGCFMLEFEAVPAKIAKLISEQLTIPPSASAPASAPTGRSCSATTCSACSPTSSRSSPSASPS
jgi:3-methyl-2-oxobutanoate hydroxymethyltransferase